MIEDPAARPIISPSTIAPRSSPPRARRCALRGPCPGLYRGYREVHGTAEIHAVTGRPRSNSFHYVREGDAGPLVGDACPVRGDGVTPWDVGRAIFVREGDRVALFLTESRDFTDVEISTTKHALGQVYVDVSDKLAPDDFARDLAPLRRSDVCAPCPEANRCAGMFERADGDVFTRDDEAVRDIVASLTGDVLDVGCGEGRYGDLLAPAAEAGALRYVGVEPSTERASQLRVRWPWAAVTVAEAESLPWTASFDHVLVLRSWNHLRDAARVVEGASRARSVLVGR